MKVKLRCRKCNHDSIAEIKGLFMGRHTKKCIYCGQRMNARQCCIEVLS